MKLTNNVIEENKAVDDATSLALSINHLIGDDLREFTKQQHDALRSAIKTVIAGVAVVGFAFLVFGGYILAFIGTLIILVGGLKAHRIRTDEPDVEVKRARKRYWTGYAFPRGSGTMLFDATNTVSNTEFNLERLDDPSVLAHAHEELTQIDQLPTVLDPDDNIEQTITDHLDTVHAELDDTEEISLSAPVIEGEDAVVRGLELAEPAMTDVDMELDNVYEITEAAEIVDTIEELEALAFETDPGDQLRELKNSADETVTTVVETQSDAVEHLNSHIEQVGDILALTTYNFYCPVCQVDDVTSQLEGSIVDEPEWYCPTCTRTFDEGAIVPKHRMKDELIEDIWDQLWIEKDDERRQIYESIEDQKSELAEREYEQRREEIRTVSGRIKDRRAKLRDLQTRARAGQGKIDEIGDLMVKYRGLAEQRKNRFRTEVNQKAAEIDERTASLIEQTRNIEQEQIDQAEQEAERKAQVIEAEQERRHRELMAVQDDIAEIAAQNLQVNYTNASASVDGLQTAKQQRQILKSIDDEQKKEFIMKTRGSVSPISLINKAHQKKGEVLTGFTPARN